MSDFIILITDMWRLQVEDMKIRESLLRGVGAVTLASASGDPGSSQD
jgi:hypothetical protein